jgi:hypothetical protein
MRVKISLTVEVDPQWWSDEYGTSGNAEVREDVRRYVRTALDGCPVPLTPVD